ncbi:MAG TPA: hypothetical protein ENJ18_14495 [Nannocystis exedens]|nr:hypothetical protein [Nannocystis exedens]
MIAAAQSPDAVALSPTVGWLLLLCGLAIGVLAIVGRESWRRFWLSTEDPRPLAVFRIVFALLVLIDIDGLGSYLPLLFSDEGYFTTNTAQELFAPLQFAGYGDGLEGDPAGFFGIAGVLQFFKGTRFSLLYFWDTPTALWIHLAAFNLAGIALAIGYRTRTAAIVTFALFNSFLYRNLIFWEGTELVLRCLFFYLLLGRSGHALSVDNWLRCRRLRKKGELSLPDGPGGGAGSPPTAEHARGLRAIYRRIPAWPRRLMILQIATIYVYTGAVKNGQIWARGDALYYALNLDHFYRFYPQTISALFGTHLFRLMTWVTKLWELLFPLVIVGMIVRWRLRISLPPPSPREQKIGALAWIVLGLAVLAILIITLPVHLPTDPVPGRPQIQILQLGLGLSWLLGMLAIWGLRRALRGDRLKFGPWTIRADTFFAYTLGRRIWLGLAVVFQLLLFVMMSIGVFQPIMLAANLLFLDGPEIQRLLAWLRIPGATIPTEDPNLPHLARDPTPMPRAALLAALVLAIVGVFAQVISKGALSWRIVGALILAGLVAIVRRRRPATPITDPHTNLAYGPQGRLLVLTLVIVHCVAVALWLIPEKGSTAAFRRPARRVFQPWLKVTQTSQSWNMFAPNPPTANSFLRVVVVDSSGTAFDLNTDLYAAGNLRIPEFGYDRMRKINRRVLGEGKRYRPWIARYHCKRWALDHGGIVPQEVRLYRLRYPIPSPEEVARSGPYDPQKRLLSHGSETLLLSERCADAVEAQPSNTLRERYDLPPAPPGSYRAHALHRFAKWTSRSTRARPGAAPP